MDNFSLSSEDIAVLCTAIDLFIPSKIPGAKTSKKHELNSLARSAKKKLNNKDTNFLASEFRSMYIALLFFKDTISETNSYKIVNLNLIKDSKKYLSLIDDLLSLLEFQLLSVGIDINDC